MAKVEPGGLDALALIAEHKVRWSGDDAVGNTNVTAAEVALFKQPEA